MKNNVKIGSSGEDKAVEYLKKNNYKILKRNFRTKVGEIDIIAFKDGITIFCEVKTRKNKSFGCGFEAVNKIKQQKIINSAGIYFTLKGKETKSRFDVISIDENEINHIENAFSL